MKPKYSLTEFDNAKSTDKLPCECYQCGNDFLTEKRYINQVLTGNKPNKCRYCSYSCKFKFMHNSPPLEIKCTNCETIFFRQQSEIKKTKKGNSFCSRSCATTYNNKNKTHGTRRSKLEAYIEEQLSLLYPNLEILYNCKDAVGSELDIYIPTLNIAFELNGVFHYEPIYGIDKLERTQSNDNNKFKLCIEHKINLCVIDTSGQTYFKPSTSQKYLDIITNIINEHI